MQQLSPYAEKLRKICYEEKLVMISVGRILFCQETLVTLLTTFLNLIILLVLQASYTTAKQYKACKGLEACNHYVWVKDVCTAKFMKNYAWLLLK